LNSSSTPAPILRIPFLLCLDCSRECAETTGSAAHDTHVISMHTDRLLGQCSYTQTATSGQNKK